MDAITYDLIMNSRLTPDYSEVELAHNKARVTFQEISYLVGMMSNGEVSSYRSNKYRPFGVVKGGKFTRVAKKHLKSAKVLNKKGEVSNFFKLISDCYDLSVASDDECVYMLFLAGADVSVFGGLKVGWNCLSDEMKVLATMVMAARYFPKSKIIRWSDLPFSHHDGKNVTKGYTQHCQMNINTNIVDYCEMLAAKA